MADSHGQDDFPHYSYLQTILVFPYLLVFAGKQFS